jgi:hypothetical protein
LWALIFTWKQLHTHVNIASTPHPLRQRRRAAQALDGLRALIHYHEPIF